MKLNTIKPFLLLAFSLLIGAATLAQDLEKDELKKLVNNKNFVFKAQSASPMGGMTRQLTPEFDLMLAGDSLVTYLPYFGRAYSAPLPGESGGFRFTSTNFDYKAKQKRKGGWEITITPNDVRDVRRLHLTISESGYAFLQITSNNRQSISYSGYISERK